MVKRSLWWGGWWARTCATGLTPCGCPARADTDPRACREDNDQMQRQHFRIQDNGQTSNPNRVPVFVGKLYIEHCGSSTRYHPPPCYNSLPSVSSWNKHPFWKFGRPSNIPVYSAMLSNTAGTMVSLYWNWLFAVVTKSLKQKHSYC